VLTDLIVRVVDFSRRRALFVLAIAALAVLGMGYFVSGHIRINTDINTLLSSDLKWRQNEQALEKAFPQNVDRLVIVVDGDTPDDAENAASVLAEALGSETSFFKNVSRPDNIPFFRKNGLLYLDKTVLSDMMEKLIQAQPLLGSLAADPSLRGLFGTLDMVLTGIQFGQFDYAKVDQPFEKFANVIDATVDGATRPLPLRSMMENGQPTRRDIQKVILAQPVLDYSALSPGHAATDRVREIAKEKGLTRENGVQIRLTGSVALNDEEFGSVADGAMVSTVLSVVLVLFILFLALRSARLIVPMLITLAAGLVATTAFAMAAIGSLNLISVAFAVMFVGIAVDFSIQFGVRYRGIRHEEPDNVKAMLATAKQIAQPIALAAGSTALGFLTFIPTSYLGVAELGAIAGFGMIVAFILNLTLLPALLGLCKPPAEPESIGYIWAAPVDRFLDAHRKPCLIAVGVLTLLGLAVASQIQFDFDPLNLKDPKTESVSTMFDMITDPDSSAYAAEILAPSQEEAQKLAQKLETLPEVDHVLTLASFIPENQDEKLALISDASLILAPTLSPPSVAPKPTDEEKAQAISKVIESLKTIPGSPASAQHLSAALEKILKNQNPALYERLDSVLLKGLLAQLDQATTALSVQKVGMDQITTDLSQNWIAPDGRAKIEVYPKGNPRDHKTLIAFSDAVRAIAPEASGTPVSIQESGKTVVGAFVEAGIYALIAISVLVWLVLRRVSDVLRLLASLGLAGILTLATLAAVGIPLNFANIIALPLLLSLGVSYAIYFISYWRQGLNNPLQSSMARAVLFSAATTLVAFGTLSLSSHPGTRSMGELLTIALVYCLLSTFLVLPVLLGRPKMD
jgi:hopanoid biosynthesis associated RND transporter like protein HpnN